MLSTPLEQFQIILLFSIKLFCFDFSITNLVLVNRTHTRFPVKADYIGFSLATTLQEYISVVLDGVEQGVYLS